MMGRKYVISYDPQNRSHKFYFGGFLNLAHNNIQEVFLELFKRFHKIEHKLRKPKCFLETIFTNEISILDYERWVKIIGDYFPVVHYIDKKDCENREERVKGFKETFVQLLETIEYLRHYYTHYHHEKITIDTKIVSFLDETLEAVAHTIKKKQAKRDHTKELLRKSLEVELNLLKELKRKNLQGEKGNLTDEDIVNEIFNDALERYFDKNEKKAPSSSEQKLLFKQRLLFLLSMFLTKAEIENCKANIKGYKGTVLSPEKVPTLGTNSIVFMTTHRVFSFLAYKGLKRKIRTSTINHANDSSKISFYNKEILVTQMLDELSKVPDVIYQNLSENDQNSFVEDLNEYFKDNVDNVEQARVIHPVIRKRYEDKFNYFALRFLDEYVNFPTLRFQIYLGDYLHDQREKKLQEGIIDREIKEKINVFGRLSEIENAKADYWEQNTEISQSGWKVFPNPSYNFPKENISTTDGYYPNDNMSLERQKIPNANKIAIKVKLRNQKLEEEIRSQLYNLQKETKRRNKFSKEEIISQLIGEKHGNNIFEIGQPTAYLSMNDIHAILYEFLVGKKTGQELEDIIVKQIGEFTLRKETQQQDIRIEKLRKDIHRELEILNKLLQEQEKRNEEYNKRTRKYPLYSSEKGKIAVWLANDIKRFMSKDCKQNWKSYQHNLLQKLLAYYEDNKTAAETLLNNSRGEGTIDLKICFAQKSLGDFYMHYLQKRIDHIKQLKQKFESKDNAEQFKQVLEECFVFLKKRNYTYPTSNVQLAHPIFLERGFMSDKPTMIEGVPFNESTKNKFADWFVHYKSYTEYQAFYDYKLAIEPNRKIKKQIKNQQKNDVYLLMMSKYLLNQIFSNSQKEIENIELKDTFISLEDRKEMNRDSKETGNINLSKIWNKTLDIQLLGNIKVNNVKLKNLGNFRKLETDSRVRTFLEYEPDISWEAYLTNERKKGSPVSPYIVEEQLKAYEKIRQYQLLEEVQALEKTVYEQVVDKEILTHNGNQNFKKYILNGWLHDIKGVDIAKFTTFKIDTNPEKVITQLKKSEYLLEKWAYILVYIRNKFAHNQLPNKAFWDYCREIDNTAYGSYAEYFLAMFKKAKKEIMAIENNIPLGG